MNKESSTPKSTESEAPAVESTETSESIGPEKVVSSSQTISDEIVEETTGLSADGEPAESTITEEDIADKEGQMEWSVAVHYVEAAIHKFIVDMRKDPATPDVVLEEDLPNLRLAWNRILRG